MRKLCHSRHFETINLNCQEIRVLTVFIACIEMNGQIYLDKNSAKDPQFAHNSVHTFNCYPLQR